MVSKWRLIIISLAFVGAFPVIASGGENEETFQARMLSSVEEARSILQERLPIGSERRDVVAFLDAHRIEHSNSRDGKLYAIIRSERSWMTFVSRDMQLEFDFGSDDRLVSTTVKYVLTGP